MSFLSPKVASPPPVPPPSPAPAIAPADAKGSEEEKTEKRLKRKKGVSSTVLTGPRGLMPEQMPTNTPYLLKKD